MPDNETPTIEINTPAEQPAPEAPITEADASSAGLSKAEIDSAKKYGLLGETEKKPGTDTELSDGDKSKEPVVGELEKGDTTDEKKEEKPKPSEVLDRELDPEKENEAIKDFNSNERALFWRLKKEKTKRQASDADREQTLIKLKVQEKENEALRLKLEAKERGQEDDLGLGSEDEPTDDKPVTIKVLEEREAQKKKEASEAEEKHRERAMKLASAQETLEYDAKARYTDFDEQVKLATDIVALVSQKKIDTLFPDARESSRITRKAEELLSALRRADEYQEGEYNPADMAYELGLLHPKAGKTSTTTNGKSGKDQALSPEEVDRIARRRTSSAAFTGGAGKRVVSYDDLTLKDLSELSQEQYRKIPKPIRDKILKENNA